MDSIVHFENERFVGRTNFHSGLLTSLVVMGVKDIEGVDRMYTKAGKLRRLFNRSLREGVKVDINLDGVTIDIYIFMLYGYSAADVSYRVQESVINTISDHIADKVKNVNVRIMGVTRPDGIQ